MVDEPSSTPHAYDWLRGAIRITGLLLMLGGTVYLGVVASSLFTDSKAGSDLFVIVVSLVTLGLGIYVLRIGFNMLRAIDAHTIGSFSFVFALIYTSILVQILPSWGVFNAYPALLYVVMFLYFGLSYWIVKFILLQLLLPGRKR